MLRPASLSPLRAAALLPALASLAAAQGALLVVDDDGGPGVDFTALWEAIDAAQDGDVVLVREGVYVSPLSGMQVIGKSLVVTAQEGEEVVVRTELGGTPFSVAGLAAGQQAVVRGLTFEFGTVSSNVALLQNVGSVRFEDCVFHAPIDSASLNLIHAQSSASVVLSGCELAWEHSKRPVVLVEGSALSCYDTRIVAGSSDGSLNVTLDGGIAIQAQGSRLFLSGGHLQGGDGEDGTTLSPFHCDGGDGGVALVAASCDVVLQGVVLAPGAPGEAGDAGCAPGVPGQPFALTGGTLQVLAGAPPRVGAPATVVESHTLRLTFDAPGTEPFALVSAGALAMPFLPAGEILVASPAVLSFPGAVPAWGKTVFLPIGSLPAGVDAATFHVQGAFLDPATASVRLGNATAVTVLAAGS